MLLIVRYLLICVSIYANISTADDPYEYLDLDIANPDNNFYKIESTNYDKILLSEPLRSNRKCVGRVLDGSKEVSGKPDFGFNYRFVKIVKIPKQGLYNPDIEEIDKNDFASASHTISSDYENIIEVHTFGGHNVMMDRFRKNDSDEYESFDYGFVDVDLCKNIGETVEVNEKKYLRVDNFKTIGTIKCNDKVLLDSLNVFYRTLEVKGSKFIVKTTPKQGFINEMSYTLNESRDYVNADRNYRVQMSLKLDKLSSNYSKLVATCGTDCYFYDGCNEKHTLIDVYEENTHVYKNRNTFCLSVKSEEVRGVKYLTVFDMHRNSSVFLVKMFKHDGRRYLDHRKNTFDVDFSNFTEPKPVDEHSYKHLLKTEKVGSNFLTRVLDVEYRMGKVCFKNQVVLDEGEDVFNREVYSCEDGILVHDECYNGEFRRYLLRPQYETNGTESTITTDDQVSESQNKVVTGLKLENEDGLKVDLHDITEHVTVYFTDSEYYLFLKPSTFVEKIGTLNYKGYLAFPNKFFVNRQYLIVGEKQVKLHSMTWKGFSFFESFVKVHTLKEDGELFVSKAKELEHFDVQDFYEAFLTKNLGKFRNFDINNLGDYYLVGANYKRLYISLVGNVSSLGRVFAPLDTDLVSRFLLLPKNTQSFVVILDCDFTDCWFKFYKHTSTNGHDGYEIQEKEPKDLELIRVFENDRDGTKPFFSFDVFKVFKHGIVYYIRIKDDLTQKIGRVLYRGNVLFEDDKGVFTRMVNVSLSKNSNGNQSGSLRLLDVERWDKTSRLFTYEIENDEFKLTEKDKVDFGLDLEPFARKNTNLSISDRNGVLSYYINWNSRDDYVLKKITYSQQNNESDNNEFITSIIEDNLDNYPVFVRLHKHDETNKFVIVVENHGEHKRPKNGEFFKITENADKHGLLLKYNIKNNKTEVMSDFVKDSYHRRNFTSHRHVFRTSNRQNPKTDNSDV